VEELDKPDHENPDYVETKKFHYETKTKKENNFFEKKKKKKLYMISNR
jgi:hypothetical protein